MGSPRVRRDPATPTKGSGRPPSAAKVGSSKVPAPASQRSGSGSAAGTAAGSTHSETDGAENETGDAIGAPASKRVLRSQGRRTMRKLLNAAMVAFDKRGYHATRVNDIVDIAKTSHGTFYLYFSNKEDLLRALVAEAASESQSLYDTLNALPVQDAPPQWEDVFGWVQAYSELWTNYAPLFRIWTDLATADPELVDMVRRTFTAMSGALSKQIGPDSSGHIIDPEAAGMATLAMLDRFHYLRDFVGQPIDDTALETMTTMVYRALFDPNA
jgi:AcrR family transcriptional regulator